MLQVVAATGTLALGIHMPCKTVVFAGDSPFLNSLMYRQVSCVIVEPLHRKDWCLVHGFLSGFNKLLLLIVNC